jgi:hypothetical protein
MVARALVKNSGENPASATRVAGSEPLKITTPINPLIQPCATCPGAMLLVMTRHIPELP